MRANSTSQPQRDETLPAPREVAASRDTTKLISTTTQPPPSAPLPAGNPTEEAKVGWGIDPSDNSMYMVIQMAPSAIETFAAGQRGQELTSRIPPMLRNRIEKVIVRFGTGPVEQFPSESELASMPLPKNASPQIANLDMRTPVNIDAPRGTEIVNAAASTQVPISPNAVLPSTGVPSVTSPPPVWNNNTPTTRPNPSGVGTDSFAPANRTVPQTLLPFGGARANTPYTPPPTTNGNVTYSGTNFSGNNYGNTPYPTTTPGNVPLVASNPNTGVYPPINEPIMPNTNIPNSNIPNSNPAQYNPSQYNPTQYNPTQYNPNTGIPAQPNYGVPVSTTNPGYATGMQLPSTSSPNTLGPLLPPPNVASRQSTSSPAGASHNWGLQSRDERDQEGARDVLGSSRPGSWVPFFLVVSFILNVYFGLWLNHLSTKYRHLLANMRGVSVADLDRA
ncbi:MAG: hypothetical protein MUF23_05815 [Pirellula sp.]|jgi:hypothetical protein|nr:hypothetical protein [Pirellula sp.]